jgi:hypothetical protein
LKKLTAIGLLLLLLYNMFGLTVTVLLFDKGFKTASPIQANDEWQTVKMHLPTLPYNTEWENTEGQDGLIRHGDEFYNVTEQRHANDTLYVTMKTNQTARDRFFELADQIQEMTDQTSQTPDSPMGKAVKLLSDLLKVYLPTSSMEWPSGQEITLSIQNNYSNPSNSVLQTASLLHCPPPEQA